MINLLLLGRGGVSVGSALFSTLLVVYYYTYVGIMNSCPTVFSFLVKSSFLAFFQMQSLFRQPVVTMLV